MDGASWERGNEEREGRDSFSDRVVDKMTRKRSKRDEKRRRAMGGGLCRKFVRKCWPGEMESGVVCLFWLNGHPQQAPSLGTGNTWKWERLEIKKEWVN